MTKFALETNEPTVSIAIAIPVRLLPQLVAFIAAAANAGSKPCVETTIAEEAPGPSVRKTLPPNVRQLPARKVG